MRTIGITLAFVVGIVGTTSSARANGKRTAPMSQRYHGLAPGQQHAPGYGDYHVKGVGDQLVRVGGVVYVTNGGGPGHRPGSTTVPAQKPQTSAEAEAIRILRATKYPTGTIPQAEIDHQRAVVVYDWASRGIFE